ncbi:hypothetical protein [Trueperella sp. LYQ143]|uniref:hypothetical protein n=1 Tax=Trueperella sp. LYQ143 TaxID=3391059 RepID=UPI003982F227
MARRWFVGESRLDMCLACGEGYFQVRSSCLLLVGAYADMFYTNSCPASRHMWVYAR